MHDLLCEFSERFPDLAAEMLHRDRHKRRNFREETITDMLMAGLTGFEPFGITVEFPANESLTGDDMDWEFVNPHAIDGRRYLRLHIQAKRAIEAPTRAPYWFYRELDHASDATALYGSQHQRLLQNANPAHGCVPLYMFYHPRGALAAAAPPLPAIAGVTVMFADKIPVNLTSGKWDVADKKVEKWRPHFLSLSDLLCFGHAPALIGRATDFTLFLLRTGIDGGLISPGELEDRLNERRGELEGVDTVRIRASEEIPHSTMHAIEVSRSTKRFADIERPRVIFNSAAGRD